ncbi:sulfotransferase domain-containing protein [Crocosphaera sp. UHCC 0190]|uniref:sulfotransferase domain-containing protein n=1 Tax=Crocosphaera sp. UHCC 0190 TaxID=3110246 RepID=UPI002B1FE3B8|nr:sulfotransferase domain-containing protein [Crocosphaera sp. UHCC 0190]MEA5509908.1 sulfotransferase domain-containing protein [Crocosphaera sp. UHCC 0190]
MRLPDFIIIGSAKSATNTLYEYLFRHPQIYMSKPKEPEFFARDNKYDQGLECYASLFQEMQSHQIAGEASTIYTRYPQFPNCAERIAKNLPNVKLIYIMRDPIARAYSHYQQEIKGQQNKKIQLKILETFEEKIYRDSMVLDSSNYMLQIEQYLPLFPRESFLFIIMDDFLNNIASTLAEVCRFLEVDDKVDLMQENEPIAANEAKTHAKWFLRSRMTEPLKRIPGVKNLATLFPQKIRDQVYENFIVNLPYKQKMEKEYLPQPMLPETRQKLLEYFREPNQRLSEFLARDLSHWNQ